MKEPLQFDPARGSSLGPKDRDYLGCRHSSVTVDDKLRRVECSSCEEILDPVEVLWGYAVRSRTFNWNMDGAGEELKRRQQKIKELKAEEKRIKARIRTARKTLEKIHDA